MDSDDDNIPPERVLRSVDRRFRSRLRKTGFRAEHIRLIVEITPGAALEALAHGISERDVFVGMEQSARELALDDVPIEGLFAAMQAYHDLAANHLPASLLTRFEAGAGLAVHRAWLRVCSAEAQFYRRLADACCRTSSGEMLHELGDALREHFGAVELSVGDSGEHENSATVWSFAAGSNTLRLRFAHPRSPFARERHLLSTASARASAALARTGESARLRENAIRLLDRVEAERRRVSRVLHDEVAQSLAVIGLQFEMRSLGIAQDSAEMRQMSERTIAAVRNLIAELSPGALETQGLTSSLKQILRKYEQNYGVSVQLDIDDPGPISRSLEVAVYRCVQDFLAAATGNLIKKTLKVSVSVSDECLRVTMRTDSAPRAGALLEILANSGVPERVALFGGTLTIQQPRKRGDGRRIVPEREVCLLLPLVRVYT